MPLLTRIYFCSVVLLFAQTVLADSPTVGDLGDIDRIQFVGNETFGSAELRSALGFDLDVLAAGHPQASLDHLLKLVESRVLDGYLHMGFPEATVSAECDERRPAIVVTIQEGPRFRCGKMEFAGADTVDVKRLQTLLKKSKLPWNADKPASFAKAHWKSQQEEVRAAFQTLGYYDAQFSLSARPESDQTATLVVAIQDEGPRAVLGEFEIVGAQKNSAQDVIDLIDVPIGTVLDADLKKKIEEKLRDAARFIKHDVEILTPPFGNGPAILRVKLLEYSEAPALSEQFSDEQQAMVRHAHWLNNLTSTEDDFEVRATVNSNANATFPMSKLRVIISHKSQACLMHLQLLKDDDSEFVDMWVHLTPELLGLDSPRHGLRYQARDLLQSVIASLRWTAHPPDAEGRISSFSFGMGLKSNSDGRLPPFSLDVTAAPVAALREVISDGENLKFANGVLSLVKDRVRMEIDAATGRLMKLESGDGIEDDYVVTFSPGLYQKGLVDYDQQTKQSRIIRAGDLPISNLLSFLATCLPEPRPSDQAVSSAKVVPVIHALLKRGAFHAFDHLVLEVLNQPDDQFMIPIDPEKGNPRIAWATYAMSAAGAIVPRPSWPWNICREFIFASTGRTAHTGEVIQAMLADAQTGPVTNLTSAYVLGMLHPQLRMAFSQCGLTRLKGERFQSDYEPFLQERSPIGKLLLAVSRTLQEVEVSEIESIVEQVPLDETDRRTLARILRSFPEHRNDRPIDVLADAFDEAWEPLIEPRVRMLLEQWAQ